MIFSVSEQSFPKLPGQLIPMTGLISGVVTPKDKTKSNPLAREKVRILSKSVVVFTPKRLPASKHGCKINRDNKSTS